MRHSRVRPVRGIVLLLLGAVQIASSGASTSPEGPLLLQNPSLSRTQIVFNFAGNLWILARDGGDARRLTSGNHERGPHFSPDGSWIAFTGEYDGNQDVYVVPASGGVPRRLTYHPGPDTAIGWTPDGKSVVFQSSRASFTWSTPRLFTMPMDGSFPTEVPLARAAEGCFSPDGTRLAYVPNIQWQQAWKRYRGGQTRRLWIANLAESSVETRVPRENSNDFNPLWVGDTLYFLSDRNGPVTLFAYDLKSGQVKEVVHNEGLDLKSASAGPGGIVYEQFGSIHLLDLGTGTERRVDIRLAGDLPEVRPHFQKIEPKRIQSAGTFSHGRTRRVCRSRRNSYRAGRKGRYPQSHPHARRGRA